MQVNGLHDNNMLPNYEVKGGMKEKKMIAKEECIIWSLIKEMKREWF